MAALHYKLKFEKNYVTTNRIVLLGFNMININMVTLYLLSRAVVSALYLLCYYKFINFYPVSLVTMNLLIVCSAILLFLGLSVRIKLKNLFSKGLVLDIFFPCILFVSLLANVFSPGLFISLSTMHCGSLWLLLAVFYSLFGYSVGSAFTAYVLISGFILLNLEAAYYFCSSRQDDFAQYNSNAFQSDADNQGSLSLCQKVQIFYKAMQDFIKKIPVENFKDIAVVTKEEFALLEHDDLPVSHISTDYLSLPIKESNINLYVSPADIDSKLRCAEDKNAFNSGFANGLTGFRDFADKFAGLQQVSLDFFKIGYSKEDYRKLSPEGNYHEYEKLCNKWNDELKNTMVTIV